MSKIQTSCSASPYISTFSKTGIVVACAVAALAIAAFALKWGHYSIPILGSSSGIILAASVITLVVNSIRQKKTTINEKNPSTHSTPLGAKPVTFSQEDRKKVFQETLKVCEEGKYSINGKTIPIDSEPMLAQTQSYGDVQPLEQIGKKNQTVFSVTADDTFNVLLKHKKGGVHPLGINMANLYKAGGGVEDGCTAQEEALCRRSNHVLGLKTQKYPMDEKGGIYCPHVTVFRNSDFSYIETPQVVDLIAVAGFDLREGGAERARFLTPTQEANEETLRDSFLFKKGTARKIRNLLRMAAIKGHTHLVLGALGCGAFLNPPSVVAEIFKAVFQEPEFEGRFQVVDFAILKMSEKDQANIDRFSEICVALNIINS